MEEQEKIDIRNHLIDWIDHFLEEGIVPQVVNPKAIRSNYILKSKVKEKLEESRNLKFKDERLNRATVDFVLNKVEELLRKE